MAPCCGDDVRGALEQVRGVLVILKVKVRAPVQSYCAGKEKKGRAMSCDTRLDLLTGNAGR